MEEVQFFDWKNKTNNKVAKPVVKRSLIRSAVILLLFQLMAGIGIAIVLF